MLKIDGQICYFRFEYSAASVNETIQQTCTKCLYINAYILNFLGEKTTLKKRTKMQLKTPESGFKEIGFWCCVLNCSSKLKIKKSK